MESTGKRLLFTLGSAVITCLTSGAVYAQTAYELTLIDIPGGTFTIGEPEDSYQGPPGSYDAQEFSVTLSAFRMSEAEVTNQQYVDFLNSALSDGLIEVAEETEVRQDLGFTLVYGTSEASEHYAGQAILNLSGTRVMKDHDDADGDDDEFTGIIEPENPLNISYIGYDESLPDGEKFYVKDPQNEAHFDWQELTNYYNYTSTTNELDESVLLNDYDNWPELEDYPNNLPTLDDVKNYPATFIRWYGAKAFAIYYGYDLPSEAQWEYVSKAGGDFVYATADGEVAGDGTSANWNHLLDNPSQGHVLDVKVNSANPFGLYNLAGNVWEWVDDWYSADFYSESVDPLNTVDSGQKVRRGGAWNYHESTLKSAARAEDEQFKGNDHFGFRIIQVIEDTGTDSDGDSVADENDAFPNDVAASVDTDGDGFPDSWNDGYSEEDSTTGLQIDAFPFDVAAAVDTDGDGYPDNWNSGYEADDSTTGLSLDAFPEDSTENTDSDADGVGNNADSDDDNDGMSDEFEIQYGLDPFDASDAGEDQDGDGATNLEEFEGNSDPTDAESLPEETTSSVAFDYDGDGTSDIIVRRASTFFQYAINSEDDSVLRDQFGKDANDIPVSGDFDGDGIADVAVRRPGTFYWFIKNSSGVDPLTQFDDGISRFQFGKDEDDIPVPADYDGDGKTDIAVRRPSNQTWYIYNSGGSDLISGNHDGITRQVFGRDEADIPVPADYDGDGRADLAVRRASNQTWYVLNSSGDDLISDNDDGISRMQFGKQEDDIPVPADFDGDGRADLAVRRPSTQYWFVLNSSGTDALSQNSDGITRYQFGRNSDDIPVVADYDGDGKADLAVRRASNYTWYILNSSGDNTDSELEDGIQRRIFGKDENDIPHAAPVLTRLEMLSEVVGKVSLTDKESANEHNSRERH